MMKPGLWLQMLTTKPPGEGMHEVAIRALEQVLPPTDQAKVAPLPSRLVAGPGVEPAPAGSLQPAAGEPAEEDLAKGG
jgi:phage I-like protein